MDLLLGEGILDSAHVLDYYPQPVATTRSNLAQKIAIILTLEVQEDRLDEFLAVAVRKQSASTSVSVAMLCIGRYTVW